MHFFVVQRYIIYLVESWNGDARVMAIMPFFVLHGPFPFKQMLSSFIFRLPTCATDNII